MKSLIPKSKAKTAYGLLSEIAALGLDEPKRIRMPIFLDTHATDENYDNAAPACGTVGCICGWATFLKGTPQQIRTQLELAGVLEFGDYPGAEILGLNQAQADALFNDYVDIEGIAGTAMHARSVARRIRKFQKKYRAQLLAKKL